MKKLLLVALFITIAAVAYAEIGAQTYSVIPRTEELRVYVHAYNPAATAISSNSVVILSPADASNAAYKATGAVIATTATADSNYVFGVTDETIAAGSQGRVCVRGPHRVLANTTSGALVAGASMSTTTTAGYVSAVTSLYGGGAKLGTLLSTSADPIVDSNGTPVTNASVYWVWINR